MNKEQFFFDLPPELIAQYPVEPRSASRLLTLDGNTGAVCDRRFPDLVEMVRPGDLMVFNNTRVLPARLNGRKDTGGVIEVMVERVLDTHTAKVQIRCSKKPKLGSRLLFEHGSMQVIEQQSPFWVVRSIDVDLQQLLSCDGHMPLPPYIERSDERSDFERYQTVYAKTPGAVAAPTAGLHFDQDLLDQLQGAGVEFGYVTLHVGAGTFQPLRVDDIRDHQMHVEWLQVESLVCEQIAATRARGGRVISVGTTSLRALETARAGGQQVKPFSGDSGIFIYPGIDVLAADILITNFHLPESTLMMLVSAFAGLDNVMAAYRHAVDNKYRFFSYGDACWMTRRIEQDKA